MQAFAAWTPPTGTLGRILAETTSRVEALNGQRKALDAAAAARPAPVALSERLRRPDVAVIAEVKRSSPSKGVLRHDLSAADRAADYVAGGAAAISVLTEPRHFAGSTADLVGIASTQSVPVLKKDFHVHPVQLLEARALGASAVLLIARALEPSALTALVDEALSLGMEPVVEVRSEAELHRALATDAPVIGVNCRDLESLSIDVSIIDHLVPMIPASRVAVAESAIGHRRDVERCARVGSDAVLVGSLLSVSDDGRAAVKALTEVPRVRREA